MGAPKGLYSDTVMPSAIRKLFYCTLEPISSQFKQNVVIPTTVLHKTIM